MLVGGELGEPQRWIGTRTHPPEALEQVVVHAQLEHDLENGPVEQKHLGEPEDGRARERQTRRGNEAQALHPVREARRKRHRHRPAHAVAHEVDRARVDPCMWVSRALATLSLSLSLSPSLLFVAVLLSRCIETSSLAPFLLSFDFSFDLSISSLSHVKWCHRNSLSLSLSPSLVPPFRRCLALSLFGTIVSASFLLPSSSLALTYPHAPAPRRAWPPSAPHSGRRRSSPPATMRGRVPAARASGW